MKPSSEWIKKNGYTYALLRLQQDERPSWRFRLGLREAGQTPRLRYKRSLGSHVAPANAGDYLLAEEARYADYLQEMLEMERCRNRSKGPVTV